MTFEVKEIKEEIKRLGQKQSWWHDIELLPGVRTIMREPGELRENNDKVKWGRIKRLFEFEGKKVIDVACNDGFYSMMALKSGAEEVLAIDIDEGRIEKACFVKKVLKLDSLDVVCVSAYDLPEKTDKKYDVAFCLGLLHRVPDPYGLMSALFQISDTVIIEWPALLSRRADVRFWGGSIKDDYYNTGYWEFSRTSLKQMLLRLGVDLFVDWNPYSKRAVFVATKSKAVYDDVAKKVHKASLKEILVYKYKEIREALVTFLVNIGLYKG